MRIASYRNIHGSEPPKTPCGPLLLLILGLAVMWPAAGTCAAKAAEGVAPPADAVHDPPAVGRLYAQARKALVDVLVDGRLEGSGFFVDPDGWVMTAAHVIRGPNTRVQVLTAELDRLDAKLVAVDLGHDLALLRAAARADASQQAPTDSQHSKQPASARRFSALPLAERLPTPGEELYLLGTPLFRRGTMIRGMMAQPETTFEFYLERYAEVCHVAATVAGGMSGGPWLNHRGEVVGLQSAVMSKDSIPLGLADMVPLDALRSLFERRSNAATPSLGAGVEETWQQDTSFWKRFPPETEGLVVRVLREDGPAQRAGLKLWDVIMAVDGRRVRTIDEMIRLVRAHRPGQTLRLDVLGPDGTGRRELSVRLGKLEVGWPQGKADH